MAITTEYPKEKLQKFRMFLEDMEQENLLITSDKRMYRIYELTISDDILYTVIAFMDSRQNIPIWLLLTFGEDGGIEYEVFETMGYAYKWLGTYFKSAHVVVYHCPHARWFYQESYTLPLNQPKPALTA